MRDTVFIALVALSNVGCPVSQWDHLLVYIITKKFGLKTRAELNLKRGDTKEYASYQETGAFLSCRIRGLSDFMDAFDTVTNNSQNKCRSFVNNVSVLRYVNCIGLHSLAKCERFRLLSVKQRSALAREKRVCFNYLQSGYFTPKYPSKSRCMHFVARIIRYYISQ
jgi:hypothetical protein